MTGEPQINRRGLDAIRASVDTQRVSDDPPRWTEIGNGQRLARIAGEELRYVADRGHWLAWDGRRWHRDPTAPALAAKRVVSQLWYEAADLARQAATDDSVQARAAAAQRWAATSSKATAVRAMLALAESECPLAARAGAFDGDRFALNVYNGTLDLRTGVLRPHRQTDMLTMLAPVAYDASAEAPRWEQFLARVLPDPDVLAWVQRYLGYALTGDVREQCLAFFLGGGANGKSVLLDVVLEIVGDYGLRAAPDLVLASHNERHPTEQADLEGRRLVVCSEIEQGKQWAESTIKRITGDATITARKMRVDFYTFAATHKIVVAANTRPTVRGTDDGVWRRMRLVPWTVRIPDDEQDRELAQRLIDTEASGILAWLVRGCLAWYRDGLGTAEAITLATEGYRAEQDLLGRWIEDRCELGADLWQAVSSLYVSYTSWCEAEGLTAWTQPTWRARMLERRGVAAARRDHGRVRALVGLAITSLP